MRSNVLRPGRRAAWSAVVAAAAMLVNAAQPAAAFGPPVPSPESTSTTVGVPVLVSLEATDDFGADAQVAFAIATNPAHGSLGPLGAVSCATTATTSDCTTALTYTPTAGYVGSDSFSYRASDQFASSAPATVTVNVAPSAAPPAPPTPSIIGGALLPGTTGVAFEMVVPGTTATVSVPGVSASLTASPADPSPVSVLTATYAPANPAFVAAGPQGLVLAGFDVRAVGTGAGDALVVRFSYPQTVGNPAPTLEYFDPAQNAYLSVRGSARVPNSLVVDAAAHTVTVVLDETSAPSLTNLTGTRFAIVGGMPLVALPVGPQLLLDKRELDFISSCGPVACRLTATGTLAIPGVAHTLRLGRTEIELGPARYRRVRVATSASLRAAARNYLRSHHGRLHARLHITVAGPGHLRRTQALAIAIRTLSGRR